MLNGIDVSNYQKGIDLSNVPADFVICKATQGNHYTNPDFFRQIEQSESSGKLIGAYHYLDGKGGYLEEARHFVNTVRKYIGHAILVVDWEGNGNSQWGNVDYLKNVMDEIYRLTKVKPLLYTSKSVVRSQNMKSIASSGYGLWVAQYANKEVTGYKDSPWTDSKGLGAFNSFIMLQYSSTGWLKGYNKCLDLDKFYGDVSDWQSYARRENTAPITSTLELAAKVINGEYGDGDTRKHNLGTRYLEVQSFINHIYKADVDTLVSEVKKGKYGNGGIRKTVLGSRYDEVQKEINSFSGKTLEEVAREVVKGEWGNGYDRNRRLREAGYDAKEVQKEVNKIISKK